MINIIKTPRINTNDDKVGLIVWHVSNGDYIEAGQAVADFETSKAVVTVDADYSGYVKTLITKGSIVKVGTDFLIIADSLDELSDDSNSLNLAKKEASTTGSDKHQNDLEVPIADGNFSAPRFSDAALNKIKSENLKLADHEFSGLVTLSIIENKFNPLSTNKKLKTKKLDLGGAKKIAKGPIVPREESVSLAKLSEIEQLSLGESGGINSTISVYFESAKIRDRLSALRMFDGSISPIILYELSKLLLKWPQFSAYYAEDQIHYYDRVDLGIALDLGKGLKVVRIKDADILSPQEIFETTIDYGLRYLDNKIRPDELIGSTITITDLSGYNVLHFRPLINGRQSAIIGIGGDANMPNYPMSFNMAFDHRVSNGREAATFLNELRARLLSYADPNSAISDSNLAALGDVSSESININAVVASTVVCDTCGIDNASYHKDFGRDARMAACFNLEGKLVPVCHRCFAGWI